jgi:hypothetical protein
MIATIDRRAAARTLAASGFALAFVLALAAGSAQAQPSQAELSAIKSNCRSDYMAHCMSVRPGGKEALQCLQSHLDSLSGACKGAVAATIPPPPPPAAAAPPPAPPPHKAVKAPPPPAPPPPKAAAAPPPAAPRPTMAAQEAMKEHCRSDYMAHCTGVPPGGKEALQCMQRNFAELSPACKTAVGPTMPHMRREKAAAHHMRERMKAAAPSAPVAIAPPQPDPAEVIARASQLPLPARMRVFRACDQDQAIVCPSVRRGGGRIIACLAMHADALSPFCRRAVAQAMR